MSPTGDRLFVGIPRAERPLNWNVLRSTPRCPSVAPPQRHPSLRAADAGSAPSSLSQFVLVPMNMNSSLLRV